MKLGIYCRISRLKDGNDLSIEDQKQRGISKANELNIPYELYIDEGLSGASEKIEDRPEFERFIGDVTSGKLTHVFAYDQSRFERNPQIRFVLLDLFKKNKVKYFTSMDGEVDLNDPQSEFFGDLLSVINKYHVTTTRIKVKSALKVRAREGKSRGIMPYGYTKDSNDMIIIDEVESEFVKRIFDMSLSGIGTRTIAEVYNSEGIQTRYAKMGNGTLTTKNKYTGTLTTTDKKDIQWSPNTVMSIIKNTIYKGERNYSGEILPVPIIIEPLLWDKVNYNLQFNKNNSGKKVEYRYLLKGLIRCGVCGRNMYGFKRVDKHDNHYMCSSKRIKGGNCGNRSINIDKIEYMVWQNLFFEHGLQDKIAKEFNFDENEVERINNKISELDKSIIGFQNERKRAIDLVIKGILSETDIQDNLKEVDSKIDEIKIIVNENKQKLFALENSKSIIYKYENGFKEFTKVTTFEQKYKIINDFINNIVVLYNYDRKEYEIKIEFKIDIPNSFISGALTNNDTSYIMFENELDKDYEIGEYVNISYLPDRLNKELFDDGTTKDKDDEDINGGYNISNQSNDNTNSKTDESSNNIKNFINPIINKISELPSIHVEIEHPNIVYNIIGEFSRRWKLSTTGRNFFSS